MDKPTTDAIRAEKTLEQFVALNPTSDYEADYAPPVLIKAKSLQLVLTKI